jgi:hypothetical protein
MGPVSCVAHSSLASTIRIDGDDSVYDVVIDDVMRESARSVPR